MRAEILAAAIALAPFALALSEEVFSCGFENGLEGWSVVSGAKLISVCESDSASGAKSLQMTDESPTEGAMLKSPLLPARKGQYRVSGKMKLFKGYGLSIALETFDANKKSSGVYSLKSPKPFSSKDWLPFSFDAPCLQEGSFLDLRICSWPDNINVARLDDLRVELLPPGPIAPPWKGSYKISPEEKDRLTPADVPGPDGIVYPDWTRAGVQGGIPSLDGLKTAKLSDFGGRPDDDLDDAEAFEKTIASLASSGGVIQLEKGRYVLERPIQIASNGIVIRGEGQAATMIDFRYALPPDGIDFFRLKEGERIHYGFNIVVFCRPQGLKQIRLKANGELAASWQRSQHSGNSFALAANLGKLKGKVQPGDLKLTAEADYENGTSISKSLNATLVESPQPGFQPLLIPDGAISFKGNEFAGPPILLAADAKRGSSELLLASDEGAFKPGDLVCVNAPETLRRREETGNLCVWGVYRNVLVYVKSVEGRKLLLDQPLRIEYPTPDGAWVRKAKPIERCGVSGLSFMSTCDLWLTSILFANAANCWAKDVKVLKCGRQPVYAYNAKFCEIRDCVFDDAWFKGGGGTAYAGWEKSYDCLMENVTTFKLRHGPLFQWSASGNVIRNCVFNDSDAQWHSGWTNENLIENCVVRSDTTANGGYGYGMWSSPPEDAAHGPNGPRNVVYNCDVRSMKDSVWLGGMNEGWIFAYNRFEAASGPGVFLKNCSFDHIFKGNVFILRDDKSPGVLISTQDCVGIELVDNVFRGGSGMAWDGLLKPAVETGGKTLALEPEPQARPAPPTPSIYEWELKNKKAGR